MFFSLFLVAFRKGQREEKHGIYCVGHTLPTLVKGHVLYLFGLISELIWEPWGTFVCSNVS